MGQSKVLKILAFLAGFAVLYVLVLAFNNRQAPASAAAVPGEAEASAQDAPAGEPLPLPGQAAKPQTERLTLGNLTADELRALGADADSPAETLKTLVAEITQLRKENQEIKKESQALMARNQGLSQMEEKLTRQMEEKLNHERARLSAETEQAQSSNRQSVMSELEKRLSSLSSNPVLAALPGVTGTGQSNDDQLYQQLGITPGAQPTQYPVKAGGTRSAGTAKADPYSLMVPNDDEIVWIKPMDAILPPPKPGAAGSGSSQTGQLEAIRYPEVNLTSPAKAEQAAAPKPDTPDPQVKAGTPLPKADIKAYTLPQNATLMGSVTMTSLIGRIQRKGSLFDPYPFKLLIGDENLAANGIFIPNMSGIVVSGYAQGDWTLSCVSGAVTSLTFVFQDGTIRTYPKPTAGKGKSTKESIGWLSDSQGVPCVSGERITNAPTFLLQRIGLTLGSAYYAAAAAAETTTSSNQFNGGSSDSTSVTGDKGAYAKNQAISAGVNEGTDWLKEREDQQFDAVYVKPGQEVAFHLDQEIAIDFELEGRQVDHRARLPFQNTNTSRSRRHGLD